MRAVRFDRYGGLDVLEVREVDAPEPGPREAVVRVRAAGINPGERVVREGAMAERYPSTFPEGEGSDFAGEVAGVGSDVREVEARIGDEVIGFTNDRASHAEYIAVDVSQLTARPPEVSWEVAGSLFVAGTSGVALVDAARVGAGDSVVVSSAAGGTGVFTTQLARNAGARVIALAGPDNLEWLRGLGVIALDYHADDLVESIRDAAGGRIDALLDTHGGGYVQLGLDLGVEPARIATIADFSAGERGATVVSHSVAARAEVLAGLADDIAAGRIEVPIAATYPLDRVRDAYTELDRGHTRGKIVLVP